MMDVFGRPDSYAAMNATTVRGALVKSLPQSDTVSSVAFSPDGRSYRTCTGHIDIGASAAAARGDGYGRGGCAWCAPSAILAPMARRHDKPQLKRELLARLEEQLATARAAHAAATEGAISDEARPENDKDTRGLEQSYLARGHAQRVAELEAAIAVIEKMATERMSKVAVGALVVVEEEGRERALYVAAHGGGLVLAEQVTVVTPTSPMGRALLGKAIDEDCELVAGGAHRTLAIVEVS